MTEGIIASSSPTSEQQQQREPTAKMSPEAETVGHVSDSDTPTTPNAMEEEEEEEEENIAEKGNSEDKESEEKESTEDDPQPPEPPKKTKKELEEEARKRKEKYKDWPMKNIDEPHNNDVLYGRGGEYCFQEEPFLSVVIRKFKLFLIIEFSFQLSRRNKSSSRQQALPENGRRSKNRLRQ